MDMKAQIISDRDEFEKPIADYLLILGSVKMALDQRSQCLHAKTTAEADKQVSECY